MLTSSIVGLGQDEDGISYPDPEPISVPGDTSYAEYGVSCNYVAAIKSGVCSGPGVAGLQALLNQVAGRYGFAPLGVDGKVGPATARALDAVNIGQQYNTFFDIALHASELTAQLQNLLTTSMQPSLPKKPKTTPRSVTPGGPIVMSDDSSIPSWAIYAGGAVAVLLAGWLYMRSRENEAASAKAVEVT